MFQPQYTITHTILTNIKKITELVSILNERHYPQVVLFEMERSAREISAHASTSIEGNPLPLTDVKQLLKQAPEHIRDSQLEVLNYNNALLALKERIDSQERSLRLELILTIHKLVTKQLLSHSTSGKVRQAPVFVNDPKKGETIFWPPDHDDVPRLLQELIEYINDNRHTIDPLLLAGLFHKQFVLIHPFMDGNGRTVRLATTFLLANLGVDTFHLFSFERYYNANVTKYFDMVGERGNYYDLDVNFTQWLEYFTDGIVDELLRIRNELEKKTRTPIAGIKEQHKIILEYLHQHPSIDDATYATLVHRAKSTRALDFRYLVEAKLIERHAKGKATYYTLKQE